VRVNFVAHALKQVQDSPDIKVACVVGFHEGTQSTSSKVEESKQAIALGATELDVVLNRGVLQSGDYAATFFELSSIRSLAPSSSVVLKLILETSALTRDGVIAASVVAGYAGFDFIKTSTGFLGLGASPELVELMAKVAEVLGKRLGRERMKVKASGGVRTLGDARSMLEKGAERIGASAGVAIVKEFLGEEGGKSGGGDDGY
jgi:deoxyribose-phosphate aldolase